MLELLNMDTLLRIGQGLFITLEISFISIVITSIGGLFLGILMSFKNAYIYTFCRLGLEFVRVMPLLVWLFIVYFGFPVWFEWDLGSVSAAIIVLALGLVLHAQVQI